jgi:hypothetical protein
MKLQEYVDSYIDMIKIAIHRLYPECDLTSQRSMKLLHNEYLVAIQEFENFVSLHQCTPDHCVLMDHFERWGVTRSDLFSGNERIISEDDFVNYYLNHIKNSMLLKAIDFTEEDYQFILQREKYLAHKMFQKNCSGVYGYQELNIRQSKKRQEFCFKVLKRRFKADCDGFYAGMKKGA